MKPERILIRMKTLGTFLFLLGCCLVKATTAATTDLGTIVMLLRSDSNADPQELNDAMLQTTTKYLDDYFEAYYANTQPENYFSHAGLVIDSYGVHSVDGSFLTTLEIEGLLFFNHDPVPSDTFLSTLLENAFSNLNQRIYLNTLIKHKTSTFLQDLTNLIVEIDGEVTAEISVDDLLLEDDELDPKNLETDSNNKRSDTSNKDTDDDGEGVEMWYEGEWVDYAIMVGAGIGGACAVVMFYVLCKCCYGRCCKENDDDDEGYDADEEDLDFPVKHVGGVGVREEDSITTIQRKEMRGRSSRRGGKFNQGEEPSIDVARTYSADRSASPSPPPSPSVMSMDSSKFTYQMAGVSKQQMMGSMRATRENMVEDSANTTDADDSVAGMSNMDMSLFTKETLNISVSDPPPFGQDISAIDSEVEPNQHQHHHRHQQDDQDTTRDLSLVEEGDLDHSLIVKQHKPYSQRSLNALEKQASSRGRMRSTNPTRKAYSSSALYQTTRQSKKKSMLGYMADESESDYYTTDDDVSSANTRDVINDLRDLSAQIDLHRRKSAI